MNSLQVAKIGAVCVTLILAFIFGIIPIKLRKYLVENSRFPQRYTQIGLSACLCFGAGVLLATIFLHMLPENQEKMKLLMKDGVIPYIDYPISELVTCLGFFLIYLLEEVVHYFVGHDHHVHIQTSSKKTEIQSPNEEQKECVKINDNLENEKKVHLNNIDPKSEHNKLEDKVENVDDKYTEKSDLKEIYIQENHCVELPTDDSLEGNDDPLTDTKVKQEIEVTIYKEKTLDNEENKKLINLNESVGSKTSESKVSLVRSITIVLALSIHSIFEGIAMGLGRTNYSVWLFCLAINSHKIFIAFSVGMELLESKISLKLFLINMSIFCLATPFGGLISTFLYESINKSNVAGLISIVVLDGISAGTIIFVVFCEVLERERSKDYGKVAKFIALVCGFAVIAGTQAIKEPKV